MMVGMSAVAMAAALLLSVVSSLGAAGTERPRS
jgi:hypothetical protein